MKDQFTSLQDDPRIKALYFSWEAGDDMKDAEPLLYYSTRLYIVYKLRDVLKDTENPQVRNLIMALVNELNTIKPKINQPFQGNYKTVKEILISNYHQCVDDQKNDDLSKELYIGFLKLMGMFQTLEVFDEFAKDQKKAELLQMMQDCKVRGLQVRNQYSLKKQYYDQKAEAAEKNDQSAHPQPVHNTPQTFHKSSNVQAAPYQSQNTAIYNRTPVAQEPTYVSKIGDTASDRVDNPMFNKFLPASLLQYNPSAEIPLPVKVSDIFTTKQVEVNTQTNSFVLSQASKFDRMNNFLAVMKHVKDSQDLAEQQDLVGVYKKLILAFNEVAE